MWGITEIGNFGGPTKREGKYPVGDVLTNGEEKGPTNCANLHVASFLKGG